MVQSFNDDFSVVWHDPKDAELTWAYDPMHQPSPLPPLAQEIVRHTIKLSMDSSVVFVNGYTFMTFGGLPTPAPEIMQRGAAAVWQEDYLPRVRQAYLGILDGDYDSVSASALGERLPVLLSESGRAFRLTMVVVIGFMSPTFELLAFCERNLGEDGAMLAATLLQGYENDSSSAGAGLGELALEALKQPAVAEALRAGRFDNLDQLPGGGEFLTRLHAYLNEYGWRPESWGVLHQPTWAEDPRVPLMLVGRYLADAASSLIGSLEAAAERREEAQAGLADLLQSEDLQELGDLLAVARLHVSISESRAMWQLLILGCLRVPILALGNKLQEAGSLNEANDIFFLSLDEVQQAAAAPSGAWLGLVSQRKLDFEHWQTLRPPGFIGAQPVHESGGSEIAAMMRHFGGGTPAPSLEPLTINGNGACAGIINGPARVLNSLAEAERLSAGDILVCKTTAPPWAPLFAIAAGVVTDSGGILSHSAICAREYSIPCVVGAHGATASIPDGAIITIDGSKGTVRIEPK